jgi:hypothetical protein
VHEFEEMLRGSVDEMCGCDQDRGTIPG